MDNIVVNDIYDYLNKYRNELSDENLKDLKRSLDYFFKYEIFYFVEEKIKSLYKYLLEYIYIKQNEGIITLIRDICDELSDIPNCTLYKEYIENDDNIKDIYNSSLFILNMEYSDIDIVLPDYDDINNELQINNILNKDNIEDIIKKYKVE